MISVIVPTYNCADYLRNCLISIEGQEGVEKEIIVVNDASTDKTDEVIQDIKGLCPLIKYIKLDKNCGQKEAINKGIEKSRGRFLIIFDADVVLYKDILKDMQNALDKNPDYAFAYCDYEYVRLPDTKKILLKGRVWDVNLLRSGNYINISSLIRKENFIGFEDDGAFLDWEMWLRVAEKGMKGFYLPRIGFFHYYRQEGKTLRDPEFHRESARRVREKHHLL
jgi:glycosyltransferase involved in cell wall biosynthesis